MAKSGPKGPRKGPLTAKEFIIFESLCSIQCTLIEIADAFSTTKDTIIKRVEEWYNQDFSTVFKQKRAHGKISLRRAQWQKATEEKNTAMQIFLGKNFLGQTDRPEEMNPQTAIVYTTKVGDSGEIMTEISSKEDWVKQQNFDVSDILNKEEQKRKPKKKKKKKTAKRKEKK